MENESEAAWKLITEPIFPGGHDFQVKRKSLHNLAPKHIK